jgi:hypothetical protein
MLLPNWSTIAGSKLNFQLNNFIPLFVGSISLRDG